METDPAIEMLCSLEYRMMDEVRKPTNPKYDTPSSEPFRIFLAHLLVYYQKNEV
jgi:hypothetical protein